MDAVPDELVGSSSKVKGRGNTVWKAWHIILYAEIIWQKVNMFFLCVFFKYILYIYIQVYEHLLDTDQMAYKCTSCESLCKCDILTVSPQASALLRGGYYWKLGNEA